jgi:hypothetical protein
VILDASNTPTYRCVAYPATCGAAPSCKCLATSQPTCGCVESSAGFTVTCDFP